MQIESNGSTFFYNKTGSGSKALILFHGFGQDHTVFDSLTPALGATYTCYCFDIPFHGRTRWNQGDSPLSKEEWKKIMLAFLSIEKIKEFDLLGFSIGARFALSTFESLPEMTRRIFFIAPDGISMNFWYSLASYPWASRKLFKSLIQMPKPFFTLTKFAGKFRLVNQRVLRFAQHEMKTESKRRNVYYTWVVTRQLRFNIEHLIQALKQNNVEVNIVLGKRDPLINKAEVKALINSLENANLILLPSGHNKLIEVISENPHRVFTI